MTAIASDGMRFANYFLEEVVKQIPGLASRLRNGMTVYDVGCGGGQFLCRLASQYPESRFVGVDALPLPIALAQQAARTSGVASNVEFKVMCASNLEKGVADLLILNEVLHEMDPGKRLAALNACRGAIRKDGSLFVLDIVAPETQSDYSRPEFMLSALVQFFESPWGSRLLTRTAAHHVAA